MFPLPPPHLPCSWNFFILQSWLPTLLASLGLSHLPTIGLLSSLPWLVRDPTRHC